MNISSVPSWRWSEDMAVAHCAVIKWTVKCVVPSMRLEARPVCSPVCTMCVKWMCTISLQWVCTMCVQWVFTMCVRWGTTCVYNGGSQNITRHSYCTRQEPRKLIFYLYSSSYFDTLRMPLIPWSLNSIIPPSTNPAFHNPPILEFLNSPIPQSPNPLIGLSPYSLISQSHIPQSSNPTIPQH